MVRCQLKPHKYVNMKKKYWGTIVVGVSFLECEKPVTVVAK